MRSSVALLFGSILIIAWANAQAEEGEVQAATPETSVEAAPTGNDFLLGARPMTWAAGFPM